MIIATRVLTFRNDTASVEVPIRIFCPEQDGDAWTCRYEIEWPDRAWSNAAGGFDSAQALLLAFQMIGAVVYASEYHKSGKLTWGKSGEGYGFPVPRNSRDQLIGDDAKFL